MPKTEEVARKLLERLREYIYREIADSVKSKFPEYKVVVDEASIDLALAEIFEKLLRETIGLRNIRSEVLPYGEALYADLYIDDVKIANLNIVRDDQRKEIGIFLTPAF